VEHKRHRDWVLKRFILLLKIVINQFCYFKIALEKNNKKASNALT